MLTFPRALEPKALLQFTSLLQPAARGEYLPSPSLHLYYDNKSRIVRPVLEHPFIGEPRFRVLFICNGHRGKCAIDLKSAFLTFTESSVGGIREITQSSNLCSFSSGRKAAGPEGFLVRRVEQFIKDEAITQQVAEKTSRFSRLPYRQTSSASTTRVQRRR